MANQPEAVQYDSGVYQLEATDPVDGGVGAVSNKPLLNLANRTAYLYQHVTNLETGATIPPGVALLASPVFSGSPTVPTPALGDSSLKIANTNWVQSTVNGRLSLSIAGSANVTLTATQAGVAIITLTGAITANIAVIVPAASGQWVFENNTTGAYTVTVKTASGTGIAVTQGQNVNLFCDGTNVQTSTTDFPSIALTGSPTSITQAQFDASTKIATDAFVQRALGNVQAVTAIGAATTLTAANFGQLLNLAGAAAFAVTLPAASAGVSGGKLYFWSQASAAVTVTAAGSDVMHVVASSVSTIVLNAGDTLELTCTGSTWIASGGSAILPNSAVMNGANWTTPAMFDSSAKLATTAFVMSMLGNRSTTQTFAAATTLTSAMGGDLIVFTAGVAATLPPATSALIGMQYAFMSRSNGASVVLNSGDTIFAGSASITTSITLNAGDTLVLTCNSGGSWRLEGGSVSLPYSAIMSGANWTTAPLYDNTTKLATTGYVQANTFSLNAPLGSGVDLNSITTPGIYHQPTNANAAAGSDYPVAQAGMLEVYASSSMVYQRYTVYATGTPSVYVRTCYNSTWGSWNQVAYAATLGNYQSRQYLTGATTLVLSASGSWVQCGGTGPYTVTLPAPTTINAVFTISHVATGTITLSTPSASIYNQGVAASTLALINSDTITLASDGSNWNVLDYYTKSPTFVGVASGQTATAGTSTTQLATTAFVMGQASSTAPVMNGTAAVGTGTTWARADHVHPIDTSRAPLASPSLTGTPLSTTPSQLDSTTKIATTAFVQRALGNLSGYNSFNASVTLTNTYAGQYLRLYGSTTGQIATLPAFSGVISGVAFQFVNSGSVAWTVAVNNATTETMVVLGNTGTSTTTSITLAPGDSIAIVAAASSWCAEQMTQAALFTSPVLTGTPLAVTASQFDSTTKIATTGFVQRALGNFQTTLGLSAATTLTAANAGQIINVYGTSAYAVTLPAASAVPSGSTFEFFNTGTVTVTVQRAGSDVIYQNSGSVTSMPLASGDTLTLVSNGTWWLAIGGTGQLSASGVFGSSLSNTGYQKLPSGLIIQWGTYNTPGTSTASSVTFPLAFPNAAFSVTCTPITTSLTLGLADTIGTVSTTGFTVIGVQMQGSSNNYSAHGGYYIATGR
jgi:hypothetical protein